MKQLKRQSLTLIVLLYVMLMEMLILTKTRTLPLFGCRKSRSNYEKLQKNLQSMRLELQKTDQKAKAMPLGHRFMLHTRGSNRDKIKKANFEIGSNVISSKMGSNFKVKFLKIPSLKSKNFCFMTLLMQNPCPTCHSDTCNLQVYI